jgi:hypothetical protein
MRNLRTALIATAMALPLTLAAAPASAHFMGGGGGHFGGGHFGGGHFGGGHFGHWGHWGHGSGFGIVDVGGYDGGCIRWRPTYDEDGNYSGRQPVNVCD